jgi:hypothetical protein
MSDFPYFVGFRATVHWCPADETHRLHVICGARHGPGWYLFVQNGCVGRIDGPFPSETMAAEYAAHLMARTRGGRGQSSGPAF